MAPVNGYDHGLTWAVELIRSENRRMTEMLIASLEQGRRNEILQREVLSTLSHLPQRMASSLPPPRPAPPRPSPTSRESLTIADWCKVGAGVLVLALVVAGKLTWSEALPLIRSVLDLL